MSSDNPSDFSRPVNHNRYHSSRITDCDHITHDRFNLLQPSDMHGAHTDCNRGLLVKSAREEEESADKRTMISEVECSMCGDIGLRKKLFRCKNCCYRYQHTYCSNWYPHEKSAYAGVCNWCADIKNRANNEETIGRKQAKATVDVGFHHHQVNITEIGSGRKAAPCVHHQLKKTKTRIGGRRYKLVSEV